MRNRIVCLLLVVAASLGLTPLQAGATHGELELEASRARYLDTEDVVLRLENHTDQRIELLGGSIRDASSDEKVEDLEAARRYLGPDGFHEWIWTPGGITGRFVARFNTSAGTLFSRFQVGAYFTIAFEGRDDTFVVYTRREKAIDDLREDLTRPQEERRIVSGIVRGEVPYNAAWSYSMGPGSIILADMWIEVCDANPRYVENHRRQWMGERWCPWSSYVASEGR